MVCNRCKMVVKSELEKFGLHPISVELGQVDIIETLSIEKTTQLNEVLVKLGFELIDDKKSRVIEKVKNGYYKISSIKKLIGKRDAIIL